jgi:HAD superfamily phosphoserine phosphatase-like hydrolase
MKIKAVVIDLDGTITTEDISGVLTELVGKKEESKKLDILFQEGKSYGLDGLIKRINFLKGLTVEQLRAVVIKNDYLRKGAKELFSFLKENNIVSIIASGNIMPVLEVFKEKLGADYLVGSKPIIENNILVLISEKEYSGTDYKVSGLKEILSKLNISLDSLVAIGDSKADKGMFEIAAKSIAINPKGNIEQYADYVIQDDLSKAIPILKDLIK